MRQDIIFGRVDSAYDLLIEQGDFVVGNSDFQHIQHTLEACQGQYRQYPLIGVGIRKMLKGEIAGPEKREIALQLRSDGYKPMTIYHDGEMLNIRI